MPYFPIFLAAGVAVGLGAAIYANREEIRDAYEHREEIWAMINQKRLEWRLRRNEQRRRAAAAANGGGGGGGGDAAHGDNEAFDLYDLKKQHSEESLSDMPPSTAFYTDGQSSSAAGAFANSSAQADTLQHQGDLRHRAGLELQGQRRYSNSSNHELRGVSSRHYSTSSSTETDDDDDDSLYHQPRSRVGSFDSDMSEPALSYSSANMSRRDSEQGSGGGGGDDDGSTAGWVRTSRSPSIDDDSYSEISTPPASDVNSDDYQSVMYMSEDDQSAYRLRRVGYN